MIAGVRGSWQTIIADLALILFMVTAAAMGSDEAKSSHDPHARNPLPARGEPLAVYRAGKGAPSLGEWLSSQPADARQHLTIISRYPDGEIDVAAREALALASGAGMLAPRPRIVLEQGEDVEVFAVLAFDKAPDWHADCTERSTTGAQGAPRKDSSCD